MVGCLPQPDPSPLDAGAPDGGGKGGYLTELPDAWRARCAAGSNLDACALLPNAQGAEAERAAFLLNLEASERGVFPPGLGALHFAHGRFAGWSVADLKTALGDPDAFDVAPADLDDLARAVNRAFVEGLDAGALSPWVSTPLCGSRSGARIDGVVDEGGDAVCTATADSIPCTRHTCEGVLGCQPVSADADAARCRPAFCAIGVCNGRRPRGLNPRAPRTPPTPDANGCQQVLDHDYCENVYDRCVCNGASRCDPLAPAPPDPGAVWSGCREWPFGTGTTPATAQPCEVPPPIGGGDGNACTQEICCEPNTLSCIHLRWGTQPLSSTTILAANDRGCVDPVPRRPGVVPGTRTAPECVRLEDFLTRDQRVAMRCDDGDPCTIGACVSTATGQCTQSSVLRQPPFDDDPPPLEIRFPFDVVPPIQLDPGCTGNVNSDCGRMRCAGDPPICGVGPAIGVTAGSTTPDCGGQGPHGWGDCISDACDGAGGCLTTLDSSVCADDGLACTLEACQPAAPDNWCEINGVPSPPCEPPPGGCGHPIAPGQCLIDGVCYAEGELRPGRVCQVCDPDNPLNWSARTIPPIPPECQE